MTVNELHTTIQEIVKQSQALVRKHAKEHDAPVNYACVFAHTQQGYSHLVTCAQQLGKVVKDTPTGLLFQIAPMKTVAGPLQLLKIRKPDPTRPERGDADFTVADYPTFKAEYLSKPGFSLIERPTMEMIELVDPKFNVRAYFSHPTLEEQLALD